jgi:hypothetical protein
MNGEMNGLRGMPWRSKGTSLWRINGMVRRINGMVRRMNIYQKIRRTINVRL